MLLPGAGFVSLRTEQAGACELTDRTEDREAV